jgi:hypothetical protein
VRVSKTGATVVRQVLPDHIFESMTAAASAVVAAAASNLPCPGGFRYPAAAAAAAAPTGELFFTDWTDMPLETRMKNWDRRFKLLTSYPQVCGMVTLFV